MKPFTGIGRIFGHRRPRISHALWQELLYLSRLYPDPAQFRFKAVIAAALRGVTEEQLIAEEIIPRRLVTSDDIARDKSTSSRG